MDNPRTGRRSLYRRWHPDLFSDSAVDEGRQLDRTTLEYHLSTLTSRSQEADFERFARRIAERAVCPNLLPHTGPSGGGDSKVDSETYPVADGLAFVWYSGEGREAASERWAFAFSAKQEWRPKVRSDIAKLTQTGRAYATAFFISNQLISDKTRADVEDELREKHGLDVRIFDLTWLLDQVFDHQLQDVAIDELHIAGDLRTERRVGPNDLGRERELEALEARIEEVARTGSGGPGLAADCLRSAILSRMLERPASETNGRFDRAVRAAKRDGEPHQVVEAVYQWAWTAFWYLEDTERFLELYELLDQRCIDSRHPADLKLWTTAWHLVYPLGAREGEVDQDRLNAWTGRLSTVLKEVMADGTRPSAALQAKAQSLMMRLLQAVVANSTEEMNAAVAALEEVVTACDGLLGFSFTQLARQIDEMGQVLEELPAYDGLFEAVVQVSSQREGEVCAARRLCQRGAHQLQANKPYDAIRSLGRSLRKLYKDESREELARALYWCGSGYERVGLLWAARGAYLHAASVGYHTAETWSDLTMAQVSLHLRLKWVELQLGRLPQALTWHEFDSYALQSLADRGHDVDRLADQHTTFDPVLVLLFLKADLAQLAELTALPDVLERQGLGASSVALLYALGHESKLVAELGDDAQDMGSFMAQLREQPAAADLPDGPSFPQDGRVQLVSRLLGAEVRVQCEMGDACLQLAESVLSGVESLLATGLDQGLIGQEPLVQLEVTSSDEAVEPVEFELEERDGRPFYRVRCAEFDVCRMDGELQHAIRDRLQEIIVSIAARAFYAPDPELAFTVLFRDELAAERALNFTSSFVVTRQLLGDRTRATLADWCEPEASIYPLLRNQVWDAPRHRTDRKAAHQNRGAAPTPHGDEIPAEELHFSTIRQSEVRTLSFIRPKLWSQADWLAVAFRWSRDNSKPPVLALVFREEETASAIFRDWRQELGPDDTEEQLRVVVIRHPLRQYPHSYRLMIAANAERMLVGSGVRQMMLGSQSITMTPAAEHNLEGFLRSHRSVGSYLLCFAISPDGRSEPRFALDAGIVKRDLHVREAWEIGRHDPDGAGIQPDDVPRIPPGREADAPVLELLRWKQEPDG